MCGESHIAQQRGLTTRRARQGDRLVVSRFGEIDPRSIWAKLEGTSLAPPAILGFSDPTAPGVFVCLKCGTKLRLRVADAFQGRFGVRPDETVEFVEGNLHQGTGDMVRFRKGALARIQELPVGTEAAVLAIPADGTPSPEPEFAGAA